MGSLTKQAIMDTARQLFSEKGFQDTSMRDIAAALQISVGNLTYHYKKKEDLIEAILLEDHQKYQKPKPPLTLGEFEQFLQKIEVQKKSRPYYYKHYTQLAQISPAVYEMQVSVLRDLSHILMTAFERLMESGVLRKEFSREYAKSANVIMTLIVYGLPNFNQMPDREKGLIWTDCVWSMMIPWLTSQGQKEEQALAAQKNKRTLLPG